MAIDAATFKIRFPEFDTVADSRVDLFLSLAVLEVGEIPWGDLYEEGVFLLAAHKLQLDQNRNQAANQPVGGGSVGPLASRKIGDVSISFASTGSGSSSDSEYILKSTVYGQEYFRLRSFVGVGMVAIS